MRRVVIALVVTIVVAACTTSPTGRRQLQFMPEAQMNEMGIAAYQQMKQQLPAAKDGSTNRYVECVADAITGVLDEQQS